MQELPYSSLYTPVLYLAFWAMRKEGNILKLSVASLSTDKVTEAQTTQNWCPVFSLAVAWIENDEPFRTLIRQKLCTAHYAGGRYVSTVTQKETC